MIFMRAIEELDFRVGEADAMVGAAISRVFFRDPRSMGLGVDPETASAGERRKEGVVLVFTKGSRYLG